VDELNTLGVEPIDAKGEPFNENEHEAMMQQPAPDDVEEGTVLEEIRKGYRMDDQVLRHSRVIVAS
jgi:molecular chaperone GrpE